MGGIITAVTHSTPTVAVQTNRGFIVREIAYHRHPNSLESTETRITRHAYDNRGFLARSADPRLGKAGLANFNYRSDLAGNVLRTRSVDAGTSVTLNDAASRPLVNVNTILTREEDTEDFSQAVKQAWQYEGETLPGRPLTVAEGVTGEPARVTERFVYASSTAANANLNLVGQCIRHYDPAGLVAVGSVGLTGAVLSTSRQLLKDAENPALQADWQGADAGGWNSLLAADSYTSLCTADATGSPHFTRDAAGHKQRLAYDLTGVLRASWLTVNGGSEQPIVTALTYSAMGQKLDELHGNGVACSYRYDPQTQRLTGIRNERPAGHASGAKVLQDLHYQYDPVGNVLNVENTAQPTTLFRNQKVVPQSSYVYDSLYQLASATGRQMAGDESANFTRYSRAYTYDNAGNLLQIRHSTADTANSSTTDITVSDRSNRAVLSTLAATPAEVEALFAAGGNQKQLQPGQMLAWTPRIELQSVTPVVRDGAPDDIESYRYDANRQRLLKTSAQQASSSVQVKQVLYLPGLELRVTRNDGEEKQELQMICVGEAGNTQVRLLYWQNGKPADVENNQVRYHYDDLIGSSGLEVNAAGKVISLEEYYPYGATAVWVSHNAVEVDYKTLRYSGRERDTTGLYYYGYRYYQSWVGRWLSTDPASTVDGLNVYAFVRNNPCSNFDAQGLMGKAVKQWPLPPHYEVMADNLKKFSDTERGQVLMALFTARRHVNNVTERFASLTASDLTTFFGPEYHVELSTITASLTATKTLLLWYAATEFSNDRFYKIREVHPDLLASAQPEDGSIFLHEPFFDATLSHEDRAETLIHELTHIKYIYNTDLHGAGTHDFYYLKANDFENNSLEILNRGKFELDENIEPMFLTHQLAIFEKGANISLTPTQVTYDTDTTKNIVATVSNAADKMNATPAFASHVAARNADTYAYLIKFTNAKYAQ